ncbi:MAG: cupin fold metalloprotein, WbuC family [Acidobacteria bacterium]|nr:cupin fold metalloprotein, WbuC family [Acidobacteriota bacterium]NIM60936.1 cupin fold metalloprotein, WbuC family [Acidobacteriota bacterium]NIO58004.1 cupin fold metalloprotein, WbuC family [Acidobacteriota bacterium]NIQ29011.1 cupin fold metalloprotein, WbuC family [Acidobacteriota bacterium]NIQ83535.1 cupin fold metalloprotein, WbuC family [Acidobacteriota bacterium]
MKRVTHIDDELLGAVTARAVDSPRRRMNHNFHQLEDAANRMLNAIEPDSYIRPHRHLTPPKDEGFLVLKGKGSCLIFDEQGTVTDVCTLDPLEGKWGVDIPAGVYHTILALDPNTVFYEVKPGPYVPASDKDFAPWAPLENTPEAVAYLEELRRIALAGGDAR